MQDCCAVILAAGDGKRMKSSRPKVLCEVLFKPMLSWVISNCEKSEIPELCFVVSENSEEVTALLPPDSHTVVQHERRGTGHAVMCAAERLACSTRKNVLVLYGDAPFTDPEMILGAYETHKQNKNNVTVVAARLENPGGYGRIVTENGSFIKIVEQRDASPEEQKIDLVNSGVYWFDRMFLLHALEKIKPANAQNEYYLTDTIAEIIAAGGRAGIFVAPDARGILGANDRAALSRLNRIAADRVIDSLLDAGADIPFRDGVIISPDAEIGCDTRILPGTIIKGGTRVGTGCEIGPNSMLDDCVLGDGVVFEQSYAERSEIASGCKIGPFARIRPGSKLAEGVKIGNFVEIKNSDLGTKTSVAHLTYIGDSDVGEYVNIGCGVVTANYDGANKFRTQIGDESFIGCNTNFIAPVKVGKRTVTAAGTTVTSDVPDGALAVGRAPQQNKPGWTEKRGLYRKKR